MGKTLLPGPTDVGAAERATIGEALGHTFRIVFFSIAGVTAIGALLATTVPKPRF